MDPGVVTPSFITEYQQCFDNTWTDATPIGLVRFVVLDSETTGLNPRIDRIVSIGAVAVSDAEIVIEDSFSAVLELDRNSEAVTVHGITRDASRGGLAEPEALAQFLDYVRDGVIVGHHIGHDLATFDAGCQRHWGVSLANRSVDTMDLALHLERDGAFAGRPPIRRFTLDALCGMFGIIPHDRHTAVGDAFITAQVFLRLFRLASKHGRDTLGRLSEVFEVDAKET